MNSIIRPALLVALIVGVVSTTVIPWSWWSLEWAGLRVPSLPASRDAQYDVLYLLSATSQVLAALVGFVFSASLVIAHIASGILPRSIHTILGWSAVTYFVLFLAAILVDLWFITDPSNELGVRVAFVLSGISLLLSIPYSLSLIRRVDPVWWANNLKNQISRDLRSKTEIGSQVPPGFVALTELGRRALGSNHDASFRAALESLRDIGLDSMRERQKAYPNLVGKDCFLEVRVKDDYEETLRAVVQNVCDLGISWTRHAAIPPLPLDCLKTLFVTTWCPEGRFDFKAAYILRADIRLGGEIAEAISRIGMSAVEVTNMAAVSNAFAILESMIQELRAACPLSKGFYAKDDEATPPSSSGNGDNDEFIEVDVYYSLLLPPICKLGVATARGGHEAMAFGIAYRLGRICAESYWEIMPNNFEDALRGLYDMAIECPENNATYAIENIWIIGVFSYACDSGWATAKILKTLVHLSQRTNGEKVVWDAYKLSDSGVHLQVYAHDGRLYLDIESRRDLWHDYEIALRRSKPQSEPVSMRQKLRSMREIRRNSDKKKEYGMR